jgi:hypothetical protein
MKHLAALITVVLALAWSGVAVAQSSPGLVTGQVPSAAQWNSYFAAKLDYNANGCPIASGCTGSNTAAGARFNLVAGGLTDSNTWTNTNNFAGSVFFSGITGPTCLGLNSVGQVVSVACGGGGGSSPAGSNGQLQYNNAGVFGAISSGTAGQQLVSAGSGAAPAWSTPSGLISTSGTTLAAGKFYGVETNVAAISATLPAWSSVAPGTPIFVADVGYNAGTNNITINAAGADTIADHGTTGASYVVSLSNWITVFIAGPSGWVAISYGY